MVADKDECFCGEEDQIQVIEIIGEHRKVQLEESGK